MKAMFFDLYETLVTHFDPDWRPPPQTIAQRLGIGAGAWSELWSWYDTAWQQGEIGSYADALGQMCRAAGSHPDSDVIAELASEYQHRTEQVFAAIEPEIVAMVRALKERGYRLGIMTNASDLDAAPWGACCLAPLFDDFVASHEVGLLKRDTRIFDLACQRLGVQPAEAIFVGDGGGDELATAEKAGLTVYWCTWFLDRWPEGIRPNGFEGDDWRQYAASGTAPFARLGQPAELLAMVS